MGFRRFGISIGIALAAWTVFGAGRGLAASAPQAPQLAEITRTDPEEVLRWCKEVRSAVQGLKWDVEPCGLLNWQVAGHSVQGRPLVYAEFGDPAAKNTTLIFSTVHGDEVTPLYLALKLGHWMRENLAQVGGLRVIVAPLVNPDGFFRKPRTRMNAHGVDVNRNFATHDWPTHATRAWKIKYHSDPRRYPGSAPHSEPETIFQEEMIRRVKPQKILAVHAPLNFLDYDGPTILSLSRFPREYVRECLKLRSRLKAISSGYFPGSLGNYAGRELGIPTLTLELPSADSTQAEKYWLSFSKGIRTMIEFTVPDYAQRLLERHGG